jgi:hypothetical protein
MLQVDVEEWAYRVVRDAAKDIHVEDNRVELKANWSEVRVIARQLGGHANAAAGEPLLWLLGVDEHVGIVPYGRRDMANWRAELEAEFEGVAPAMQHYALRYDEKPFEALVFGTDAPPYVVRNPKRGQKDAGPFDFEVPWREGRTRSARRSDLILMLRPIGRAPAFEPVGANITLLSSGDVTAAAYFYAEHPEQMRILIPTVTASIEIAGVLLSLREVEHYPDGQDPDVIRTRSHLSIQGAGKLRIHGSGRFATIPSIPEHVVLHSRFKLAGLANPVSVAVSVPSSAQITTTGAIGSWRFGQQ